MSDVCSLVHVNIEMRSTCGLHTDQLLDEIDIKINVEVVCSLIQSDCKLYGNLRVI